MPTTVACAPDADRVVCFAAAELARYLTRMTGESVVVEDSPTGPSLHLQVDPHAAGLAGADAFEIEEDGRVVSVRSRTPRGLLMAAYHYLRLLGCRFNFPGPQGEHVPQRRDPILRGVRASESPAFDKRGIVIYRSNDAFEDWIDFMPKVGLNALGVHAFLGTVQADRGSATDAADAVALAADRGLQVDLEAHCFGEVFCPADQAGMAAAQEHLLAMLGQLPDSMQDLFLWQADGHIKPCECAEHRGMSVSDQTLLFANHMAQAAHQARAGARLCYLAYHTTLPAPTSVAAHDGVFLEWAPIARCMSHPLDDPACPVNAEEHLPHLVDNLRVFAPDQAQVLGYWLDSSLFNRGRFRDNHGRLPWFPELMRADFRCYRGLGIRQITTFGINLDRAYFGQFVSPSVLAYAHLLWDPEADIAGELRDFCAHTFGTEEALAGFVPDTAVDPQHGPDARAVAEQVERAIPVIDGLARDACEPRHREGLRRLAAELEHRLRWQRALA